MVLAFIRDRAALERSIPLDTSRVFIDAKGERLVESIGALLQEIVHRERAFRPADQVRWRNTLEVLIANLALAVFNRVDSRRFVGISFNANDYSGTPHSVRMLARMRDGLAELGLVEGQHGYRRTVEKQVQHGRRTRLRATAALRNMFAENGVTRAAIGWSERRDVIILRQAAIGTPLEPSDVRASRSILLRQNERLGSVHIGIPDDAWARIADRYYGNDDDAEERLVAGEEGTQLYRIFKGDWQSGGRLYGGWWINLTKA
ncbi:MAG: hypothetical protein E5V99_07630, partial [Mesorhizobium sp.]